jgi:hypothetical protein
LKPRFRETLPVDGKTVSTKRDRDRHLADWIPAGRVLTLDLIRGLAIVFMTVIHQGFLYGLEGGVKFLWRMMAYLAVPFFLSVSGMAMALSARSHRWPFRMVVHGAVLFAVTWSMDVVFHRSFRVDWDIFQIIGVTYVLLGSINYLGSGLRHYLVLVAIVVLLTLYPPLRPDRGIFPLWPLAVYILSGYALAHFGTSRWNRVSTDAAAVVLSAAVVAYFVFYRISPNNRTLSGILLAMAIIFLLSVGSLRLENHGWLKKLPSNLLIRFGQYPLTLYFIQQAATLAGLRYDFRLEIADSMTGNWLIHSAILVLVMSLYTFVLDRVGVLRMEWWLREIEAKVMTGLPDASFFQKGYRF